MVIGKLLGRCNVPASADPDLQIRGGGGHPDPEIKGMGRSKKIFFPPFGPQFGPEVRGAGPPGPTPGSAIDLYRHLDAGKLKDLPRTIISFKTRDNKKPKSLCRNSYMYPSHISHLL